jgi:hypothetical protein
MSHHLTANTTAVIPVGTSIHQDPVGVIAANRIVVGILAGDINGCREALL